jgi:hypothetical protein
MKKSIVVSVLGITATLAIIGMNKAQAQGSVVFANYTGGLSTIAPVTFSGAPTQGLVNGEAVGYSTGGPDPTFTAQLLYSYGVNLGTVWTAGPTTTFLTFNGDSRLSYGPGLFGTISTVASITGYTTGAADFEIEVYSGANYASSTIRGTSSVIQFSVLPTTANGLPVGDMFSDNSQVTTPISPFTVSPVSSPEPSSLALAGLGGFGMLMAFRRKKA